MTDRNTPAFPLEMVYTQENEKFNGMHLRDYFAAKALQPFVINFLANEMDLLDPNGWMDGLAMDAYSMADAMLKARQE